MTKTATVTMPAPVAHAMLTQALTCAAKRIGREVLEGVLLRARDGRVLAVSADGFRLAILTAVTPHKGDDFEALIPRATVEAAIKMLTPHRKSAAVVEITASEISVSADTGSSAINYAPTAGTFPNYEQLVPPLRADKFSRFAINGKLLSEVGKIAGQYATSGIVRVQPGAEPGQPIRFDWFDRDAFDAVAVIMPMYVDWDGKAAKEAAQGVAA